MEIKQETHDIVVRALQPRKVNITILGQARKMVYDVYCFMKKDAVRQNCKLTDIQVITRTAEATQTSISTVKRILREAKTTNIFKTPGTVRNRAKPVTDLNRYNEELVRNCIRNFQNTDKKPTVSRLLARLQTDVNFNGSETSVRKILKELGFKWKKVGKNIKSLIECAPRAPVPVPVFVEIDPSCNEAITITIKKEMDNHNTDTDSFEDTDDLYADPLVTMEIKKQLVSSIKKEDEYQGNVNLSNINVVAGGTIKRETEDGNETNSTQQLNR